MASPTAISVAFIERRPLAAARVLAAIDPGDAAALVESIPSRVSIRAFHHIDAWAAAAVVERMSAASAAGLLRALDLPAAMAILRLLASDVRAQILGALSQKLRRDFEISLSYPADAVGAHMSTAVMTMSRAATVQDALEVMKRSPAAAGDVVFVVDGSKKLLGTVTAAALLRLPEPSALGDIMDDPPAAVSARARLTAVAGLEAWDLSAYLPVTNRQKQIIGVLLRRAMRQALIPGRAEGPAQQATIAASMAEAFLVGTYGLAQLLADVRPERNGRESNGG